jgi:lipopolysaccharide heptosyltransferase II
LRPLGWMPRRHAASAPVRRVLLLRLERIGDLLMVLGAIADARAAWPDAEIDLAVGSWNLALARLIPGVGTIHTADVPWLAREGRGDRWTTLVRKAREWRARRYDVSLNFEPDIRSNFLAWLAGAPARHGYWTGGGGSFLTDAAAYEPASHVSENARRLVARAASTGGRRAAPVTSPSLALPPEAIARAAELVAGAGRPLVGVHVSGGRESKQWHLDRFAEVARQLAERRNATIVLTGSEADRPLVTEVEAHLNRSGGTRIINVAGALDLVQLAALLSRLDVFVTGDTGPMHLASAVRTPVVALFGPADPRRYGPTSPRQRVLRVDLPCSPCGQVRLPPKRCRGHVPDCMDGIRVDAVTSAALDVLDMLDAAARVGQTPGH